MNRGTASHSQYDCDASLFLAANLALNLAGLTATENVQSLEVTLLDRLGTIQGDSDLLHQALDGDREFVRSQEHRVNFQGGFEQWRIGSSRRRIGARTAGSDDNSARTCSLSKVSLSVERRAVGSERK